MQYGIYQGILSSFSHWQWLNGTRIYPPLSREFTLTQFAKCSCDSSPRGLTLLLMLQDDNLQGKGEQTDRSNHILRATVKDKKQVRITTRVLTQSGLNYPPVSGLSTSLPNYTAGAEAFELLSCDLTRVQNQKVLSVPHVQTAFLLVWINTILESSIPGLFHLSMILQLNFTIFCVIHILRYPYFALSHFIVFPDNRELTVPHINSKHGCTRLLKELKR